MRLLPASLYVVTIALLVWFAVPVFADAPCESNGDARSAVFVASDSDQRVRLQNASFRLRVQEIAPRRNHVWRKTDSGWQQIPVESRQPVHALELPHERPRIHPFSVASLTLLLALAAMAWASSEWDWSRFVGDD